LEEAGSHLSVGSALIPLPVCSIGTSRPDTGFVLGAISFGLYCFQELSLALLVRWGWKAFSTVDGAMIQLLTWA